MRWEPPRPKSPSASTPPGTGWATSPPGNLPGNNIFNALLILGPAAPVRVAGAALGPVTWLLGLSVLTAVLLGTRERLGRAEGAALVALHLGR